jgi:hypothetical protein
LAQYSRAERAAVKMCSRIMDINMNRRKICQSRMR